MYRLLKGPVRDRRSESNQQEGLHSREVLLEVLSAPFDNDRSCRLKLIYRARKCVTSWNGHDRRCTVSTFAMKLPKYLVVQKSMFFS
jgi:hypothetical protein